MTPKTLRFGHFLLLAVLAAGSSGCGAGVISAVLIGGGNDSNGSAQSTVTFDQSAGPLFVEVDEIVQRVATLRNLNIAPDAEITASLVWRRAGDDLEDEQRVFFVSRGSEGETRVLWLLETGQISAAAGDVTARDVDVMFVVRAVSPSGAVSQLIEAPFKLLRKPILTLIPNDPMRGITSASVLGGPVEMEVESLPQDQGAVRVEFVSLDPDAPPELENPPPLTLSGTEVDLTPVPGTNVTHIRCQAPPISFPTDAFVRVVHQTAGRSTPASDRVLYRPELTGAVSRRGAVTGGDLVSVNGFGLVPFDFSVRPPRLDFGRIRIRFKKGGEEVAVDPQHLRPSLSSQNNIVLLTPASPDGRAGPATVELRVVFLPSDVGTEKPGLFSYGAGAPGFEPRGIALEARPLATVYGNLRGSLVDGVQSVDAAMLNENSRGEPQVRLYSGLLNGMFARLGTTVPASQRGVARQLNPVGLAFGEFTGDTTGDLFVLNRGDAVADRAEHTLLRGVASGSSPLAFAGVAYRALASPDSVEAADVDRNARTDLLIGSGARADELTQFLVQRDDGSFDDVLGPFPSNPIEASAVLRVDSDPYDDLVFAAGGAAAKLFIAFGAAGPAFDAPIEFDLSPLTLTGRRVVGIHASGPGPERALTLTLTGPMRGASSVVVLLQTEPRGFSGAGSTIEIAHGPLADSLGADLDGDGIDELVLAFDQGPLQVWAWDDVGSTFVALPEAVRLPGTLGDVHGLGFGLVGVSGLQTSEHAVFVTHTQDLGNVFESRVTSLLVGSDGGLPVLEDPEARFELSGPARAVAVGPLEPGHSDRNDVAIYDGSDVVRLFNDGFGGLSEPAGMRVAVGAIVPSTLVAFPHVDPLAAPLVYVTVDGRVGIVSPGESEPWLSPASLLDVVPGGSGTPTVLPSTQIRIADVDLDGVLDLVVLLSVDVPAVGRDSTVLALRGDPDGPFPFAFPDAGTDPYFFGAEATSIAIGEFVADTEQPLLEVVAAVPSAGLVFLGFKARGPRGRFLRIGGASVTSGLRPLLVSATDFEGDGLDDVVLASRDFDSLHLFRRLPSFDSPGQVGLHQTGQTSLPPGTPRSMWGVDIDGDAIQDVIVHVETPGGPNRNEVFAVALDGVGGFGRSFQLPSGRVGDSGELRIDIGDMNRDGVPDLVLGSTGTTAGDLVRELFGSRR